MTASCRGLRARLGGVRVIWARGLVVRSDLVFLQADCMGHEQISSGGLFPVGVGEGRGS